MHTDIRRMLLAQKAYVEGGLALILYCARLVDEEKTAESEDAKTSATLLLDMLTPIAKSWPSQWCLEVNNLAIQIHGGYGYTREYNVEQLYRDNRLNPIHEGTHGIQALDLLGRKVIMNNGAALTLLSEKISDTLVRANSNQLTEHSAALKKRWDRLLQTTQILHATNDVNLTLANATVYLEVVGHLVIAGYGWSKPSQLIRLSTPMLHSIPANDRPAIGFSAVSYRAWMRSWIYLTP